MVPGCAQSLSSASAAASSPNRTWSELAPAKPTPLPINPADGELIRIRLQLPAFLIVGMTERARELEMRPPAWLAALIQFNLSHVPVLAIPDLFVLQQAATAAFWDDPKSMGFGEQRNSEPT
jgi:hypothetical protein